MKTILYLGTDPAHFESQGQFEGHVIHFPVIKIVPRPFDHPNLRVVYDDLEEFTHLIFTSKNAVAIFFDHLGCLGKSEEALLNKQVIAIGSVTAAYLTARKVRPTHIAELEQQEGIINLLKKMPIEDAYFFLPRSSSSRPMLTHFLRERQIRYQACDLYDTVTQKLSSLPDLDKVDEIVFTSPSTVKAFLEIFGALPKGKKLVAIGPITEQVLLQQISQNFTIT